MKREKKLDGTNWELRQTSGGGQMDEKNLGGQ